ncbi:tol-pal system-associated acyl-CoA thioesterase [Herbaspirillum sp. RTI4]|uniref:tol-pal system-associated acyl-CoA thioesterase n=1 Tax=Herbaspirillum sp. RTI4 TaxID=3048640 RepID=UPI002AB4A534|nr:tol-pal system-associated acyl-CoA thioesterase [Herbaspirillum sp. RTI4]MDY7579998.1 tol-pal system-associated acyl-CoA thioesterase [Herbaspirillum sp. RTI4]MEA9982812.1 tol-pal system-associated acyl-CoA thioesterase [Herbaspirillum sp. RTI4]
MSARYVWPIRVYYEDTDAGGIVFYANYLKFFERARTEWLRAQGFGQHEMQATYGAMFVVKSTTVDYVSPARLDDELELTVEVEKTGNASVNFVQEAWRIDRNAPEGTAPRLLARGRICVVCVDMASFRPQAIPAPILNSLQQANMSAPAAEAKLSA